MVVAVIWLAVVLVAMMFLILRGRRISKFWFALLGIAPVVAIHLLNPVFRFLSFHSFLHGAITYQILNGTIPPQAPLLGGHALGYPWGTHLMAAGISAILNVTPFVSFVLVNTASLFAVMVLVYMISKTVIHDEIANILSVAISIYGISIVSSDLLRLLPGELPEHFRGIPVIQKFINTNTLPLGLASFLLFVFCTLRLLRKGVTLGNSVLMLLSILACGFFYPAFLPGIVACTGAACLVCLVSRRFGSRRLRLTRAGFLLAVLAVSLAALGPYLTSIGQGIMSQVILFDPTNMLENLMRYLIVSTPLLLIVLFSARRLRGTLQRETVVLMTTFIGTNLACYLCVDLPFDNEYKFMVLSTVVLGILGGISLSAMLERGGKALVFGLLVLFLLPAAREIQFAADYRKDNPRVYFEKGTTLHSVSDEREELCIWIRETTANDAIFIDDGLDIPVCAQRQLFVPTSRFARGKSMGYGQMSRIVELQGGYDHELIERRRQIADCIYDSGSELTESQAAELRSLDNPVFLVLKGGPHGQPCDSRFEKVFTTCYGKFSVYELRL